MAGVCPVDGVALAPTPTATGSACPKCGGAWLAYREAVRRFGAVRRPRHDTDREAPGCCPVDDTPLRLTRHLGLDVPACPACNGVWLDASARERLAAAAARAAAIAALSLPPATPTLALSRNVYRGLGALAALLSLAAFAYGAFGHWEQHVDFDVTGFLFLVQNADRVGALFAAFMLGAAALGCWTRARAG